MDIDILSADQRDSIVAPFLREYLAPLGLSEVSPRRWIDGSNPPVRRLFELQLLKGASLGALWGVSLDFVPHISAGRIKWHRSNKTARFDICIAGYRHHLIGPSFLQGPARLRADLHKLMPEAVILAQETWNRCSTTDGMIEIIHENRAYFLGSWLCDISPAYAFLVAKTGDIAAGRRELDHYIKFRDLDEEEAAKLQKGLNVYADL